MAVWKCSVCGYMHWGEEALDKCPKCGVSKEKFELLDEAAEGLVTKSRYTNELHMELFGLLTQVLEICEEGAEIDLDPGCFKIFDELFKVSVEKQQEILAEVATHVNKGKWN